MVRAGCVFPISEEGALPGSWSAICGAAEGIACSTRGSTGHVADRGGASVDGDTAGAGIGAAPASKGLQSSIASAFSCGVCEFG